MFKIEQPSCRLAPISAHSSFEDATCIWYTNAYGSITLAGHQPPDGCTAAAGPGSCRPGGSTHAGSCHSLPAHHPHSCCAFHLCQRYVMASVVGIFLHSSACISCNIAHVCVHAHMRKCTCVYVHPSICVCTRAHAYRHVCALACSFICMQACLCMCACRFACLRACGFVCVCSFLIPPHMHANPHFIPRHTHANPHFIPPHTHANPHMLTLSHTPLGRILCTASRGLLLRWLSHRHPEARGGILPEMVGAINSGESSGVPLWERRAMRYVVGHFASFNVPSAEEGRQPMPQVCLWGVTFEGRGEVVYGCRVCEGGSVWGRGCGGVGERRQCDAVRADVGACVWEHFPCKTSQLTRPHVRERERALQQA